MLHVRCPVTLYRNQQRTQNMENVNQFSRHISLENVQPPRTALLNASSTGSLVSDLRLGRASFHRRTAEGSRLFRENFNSVIQEIRPLVEQARTVNANGISIATLLNTTNRPLQPAENQNTSHAEDTFVINLEALPTAQNLAQNVQDNNAPSNSNTNEQPNAEANNSSNNNNNNNNNNTADDGPGETLRQFVEAHAFLQVLQRYIPFVLILLAKALYDHREGILNFIILFITFSHANSVVKKEATRQGRRSFSKLCIELVYISACIIFIGYIFEDEKLYLNLVFIPPYTKPLTVWELLWTVGITDFILKLLTIMLKIGITMFSVRLLPFQKRGKIYLFIEATSQLYRSLATIQPWLYYLLESYQGPEKVVGVFLSAAYMVSKGADLMARLRLFKAAFFKLLQNVTLGASPSKDQIQTAGNHCPICHDEYETPVLLQCRHIFCESCVTTWFDREQTCPLCRAKVVDDPSWRDGSTTYFTQLF